MYSHKGKALSPAPIIIYLPEHVLPPFRWYPAVSFRAAVSPVTLTIRPEGSFITYRGCRVQNASWLLALNGPNCLANVAKRFNLHLGNHGKEVPAPPQAAPGQAGANKKRRKKRKRHIEFQDNVTHKYSTGHKANYRYGWILEQMYLCVCRLSPERLPYNPRVDRERRYRRQTRAI